MEYLITRLTDRPELKAQAAAWFHAKWGVPEPAYLDSMDDALRRAALSRSGIWRWRGRASSAAWA